MSERSIYYTYVLYSKKLNRCYIGSCGDLHSRISRHNRGYESFTSKGVPWILVWSTEKETRPAAVSLEMKLKRLNRKRLLSFLRKYADDLKVSSSELGELLGGKSSQDET